MMSVLRASNHHGLGIAPDNVSDALQRQGCGGVVFGLEKARRAATNVEDKRHQYLWPSCRADNSSSTVEIFARLAGAVIDPFDRLVNFLLPKVRLGHDPGDGPPMTRDNDGLPALDIVEQTGGDALWRPKPELRACCVTLGW